jgi:hypothetical protein
MWEDLAKAIPDTNLLFRKAAELHELYEEEIREEGECRTAISHGTAKSVYNNKKQVEIGKAKVECNGGITMSYSLDNLAATLENRTCRARLLKLAKKDKRQYLDRVFDMVAALPKGKAGRGFAASTFIPVVRDGVTSMVKKKLTFNADEALSISCENDLYLTCEDELSPTDEDLMLWAIVMEQNKDKLGMLLDDRLAYKRTRIEALKKGTLEMQKEFGKMNMGEML